MNNMQSLLLRAATSGSDPQTLFQEVIEQVDVDEVTKKTIRDYLDRRPNVEGSGNEVDEIAGPGDRIAELTAVLQETGETLKRVYAEVETLREDRDRISARLTALLDRHRLVVTALGLCGDCLGEDVDCPVCGGRGKAGSGFYRPNPHYFSRYVEPVLASLGLPCQKTLA